MTNLNNCGTCGYYDPDPPTPSQSEPEGDCRYPLPLPLLRIMDLTRHGMQTKEHRTGCPCWTKRDERGDGE